MKHTSPAYIHAVTALDQCSRNGVFSASGLPGGYEATWARDSMIISLGASLVSTRFKSAIKQSLALLSRHQSALGQIPNAVGDYNSERQSSITYNSIDSGLWYLIGHGVYEKAYKSGVLRKKYKGHIERAFTWLSYQDPNEDKLLAQQPTMDWQDAFPHKYGHVINTQALYYGALRMYKKNKLAEHLKQVVNGEIEQYLAMYDSKLGYYVPWNWKNHDEYREQEEWFDTVGNLLAIVTGLATPRIAATILGHIDNKRINMPYPCKSIWPPIRRSDKEWHPYFAACDARTPYQYSNAGVWPFAGGLYVAALVKNRQIKKARQELLRLEQANKLGKEREWEFNEWLDGKTGKPKGTPVQGWSAGAFIFAFECVHRESVLYFE